MAEKKKRPIYKKWWFWLIVVILIIAISTGGDDEAELTDQDQSENAGNITEPENEAEQTEEEPVPTNETEENQSNADEEITQEELEEEERPQSRDNSSAEKTTLNAGTFLVGTDIPAGRYVITGDGSGNFFVYDGDMPVVNEILDPEAEFGVASVTTNLEDGQEIEISGINVVTFTPAETTMSDSLTTGSWEVGLDIEEGRYDVTAPSGSGNFFVYNSIGLPEVNEILDATGDFGVKKITVNLEDGQLIEISGINRVDFTAK